MSLPPAFLDELRSRLSLGQVVGRKVTWDARKSNHAKGDLWAPCPFHQEKTASFHVDDRKGYYYCFGCHAKGDAISFVRETENVGFMEAIEILAREAGMPLPERDPRAQEKADRRTRLSEAVEAAARHYRLQLKTAAGAGARDDLARRRLSEAAQERFEIGYAPRSGLFEALAAKGFTADEIVDAGLCIQPDADEAATRRDGGAPFDRFRDRIIFPIRDARGRAISLGGRAMDPAAPAKYLNGPETDLFDKGRSLYNHGPAREAAGKGRPLIVAEGYMDVIALVTAGFEAAVAPLGTAVTEDQLRLLWRIHPEPVVALDGDRAGVQAAMRLMDLALPLIEAGQSLRFALMPQGKDPDDLIREGGAAAMQAILDKAEPMVALLWRRETEGRVFDSPERRATLDRALREAIGRIRDSSLKRHYGDALKELKWARFRAEPREASSRRTGRRPASQATPSAMNSRLARESTFSVVERMREMALIATCLTHQDVIGQFEDVLAETEFVGQDHQALITAILANYELVEPDVLIAKVGEIVGAEAVERIFRETHVRVLPPVMNRSDTQLAVSTIAESLAKLSAERDLRAEIEHAAEDIADLADEYITRRLADAAAAANLSLKAEADDRTVFDIAESGARVDRAERSAFRDLLARIGFPQESGERGDRKVKK